MTAIDLSLRPHPPLGRWLRRRLLGIPLVEVSVARRGFHCGNTSTRLRLERIGEVFLGGYHSALEEDAMEALVARLEAVEPPDRGFAYEGAAMGLALQGLLLPWRWARLREFVQGAGDPHRYMVHVGVGWAVAVLPIPVEPLLRRLDPLLRWLAVDGFGFHHGYFAPRRHLEEQKVPVRLRGYARRAFDQGLGRALWFADGGDVTLITQSISRFPEPRRADLWSGVGLACSYAGGVEDEAIHRLRAASGSGRALLAQGAAFAAKARQRAGNPAHHTDRSCTVLCGMSGDHAARVTDEALLELPPGSAEAYEAWRQRIRRRFEGEVAMG